MRSGIHDILGLVLLGLAAGATASAQDLTAPNGTVMMPFEGTVGEGAAAKKVVVWIPVDEQKGPGGLLMTGRNIMTDGMKVGGFDSPGGLNFPSRALFPSFNSDSRFGNRAVLGTRDPLFADFFKQKFLYSVMRDQQPGVRPPNRAERERMAAEAYKKMLEEEAETRKGLMEGARPGITVWSAGTSGATGINVGRMKDGRMVLVSGEYGVIHLDAIRLEGGANSEFHVNTRGIDLEGHAGARFTLVGVHGETSQLQVGGKGLGFDAKGSGRAGVLAEASADGNLILDDKGLRAKLGGNAFAGAKASGEAPLTLTVLGIKLIVTPNGYVAAGAGIDGDAYAGVSSSGVRVGAKAGGTLGLGAGAGVDVELDVSEFELPAPDNSWAYTWEPPSRGPYGFPSRPVYNCHAQASAPCSSILRSRGFKQDYYGWYRPSSQPGGYGYDPNPKPEDDYASLARFFKKVNDPNGKTLPAAGSTSRLSDADVQALRDWLRNGAPSGNQDGRYAPTRGTGTSGNGSSAATGASGAGIRR